MPAQLGFVFRRRYAADHLSGRDLVAFVHGQRREPAGIFGRVQTERAGDLVTDRRELTSEKG